MAALSGDRRHGPGRELDGAARHPRPERRGLRADSTTRPTRASCWPRPATRAAPGFPTTTLLTGGSRVRRGDRRRGQARARDHAAGRDDGRRLLRAPVDRPAGDVVARLGRRLPGPERLPGRAARDRRVEQLRPLELARLRRGHRRGGLDRDPTAAASAAYDRAEAIVRDQVPVVPLSSTARAGRCRATGCSVPARTASGIVRMAGLAWAK